MKRRLVLLALFLAIIALLVPAPALAIGNPDQLTIDNVKVFQDIFETGDWLVVCKYTLSYTATPSEAASSTYLFSLFDTSDGLIASTPLNFYGTNLISIWISKNTVEILGLSWGLAYTAKVIGNPSYFGDPPPQDSAGLSGFYYPITSGTLSQSEDRDGLSSWIISRVREMETPLGMTLTVFSNGKWYLNATGSSYVEMAIPGVRSACRKIFQYTEIVPEITWEEFDYDYQMHLYGDVLISTADRLDNWSTVPADIYDLEGDDRIEGRDSIKVTVTSPSVDDITVLTFDSSVLLSLGSRDLEFWFKCDRASTAFTYSRVYVYDYDNDYKGWNFIFDASSWILISKDLSLAGDYSGGSGNWTVNAIDRVVWEIKTPDTTSFWFLVDGVIAKGVPGIGELTHNALKGIGESLGVSATFVGGFIILMVYVIAASIIYFVTANSVAAMAIALPVLYFGNVAGLVPLALTFVIGFLLAVAVGYFIWIRGT